MKTASHLHASIFCLFLFAFSTTALAAFLHDIDGHPIYNGGSYYIVPVVRGKGGGLELAKTGSETCPLTVVQAPSEISRGLPARLSSPLRILFLTTEFLLHIEFAAAPDPCVPSPARWNVDEESQTVKITNETMPIFGPFRVRTYGDDYKLEYCNLESEGNLECKDLGISIDEENKRRLVVKDGDPFVVQFVKADDKGHFAGMSIV